MTTAPFIIRPARVEDADAIAHVHHQSWEETYPGIMPPELIERVSLDYRLTQWRRIIHERTPGVARFVAELGATPAKVDAGFASGVATGKIIGVAQCGPAREPELKARHEVMMVYVLRRAQGIGVGSTLMRAMFDFLNAYDADQDDIDRSIGLWVLNGNDRAIRFYEKIGATIVGGVRRDERNGVVIEDIAMRWEKAPSSIAPQRSISRC